MVMTVRCVLVDQFTYYSHPALANVRNSVIVKKSARAQQSTSAQNGLELFHAALWLTTTDRALNGCDVT